MTIIKVNQNDTNIRLDNFLMKLYPNQSKGAIFKAIRTNKIKVNGKKPKFDYRLKLGDEIKVFLITSENASEYLIKILRDKFILIKKNYFYRNINLPHQFTKFFFNNEIII